MREFTVYAPAKLNLYLDVIEKRPDGYHNIKTLFEKIDLKDEIIVRERPAKGISVKVEPIGACPLHSDNIAYKAIQALFREAGVDIGLEIVIKKRIPVSAGLGGGSSDAASLLRSVNEAFELGASFTALFSIANDTGKDMPFFMLDATFATGMGTGELLEPIDTDVSFSHIIIKPGIVISTSGMYKKLDGYPHMPRENGIQNIIPALKKRNLDLIRKSYYNIFEEMLEEYRPYIEKAKTLLNDAGAGSGFLSGSGPSVFCTLNNREEAMEIAERIPKEPGMEVFVAASYKGGIYGDN